MNALVSFLGIVILLGFAWLLSTNRKAIRLRTVGGALLIQVSLGAFVLFVPFGIRVLEETSKVVQHVINYSNDGISFLFGTLVSDEIGFVFALRVLPVIIFFSSLIAVLYHFGIMQLIVNGLGGALQKTLGTSRAESLSAAANIFVGQTEAPLTVKPYIPRMTKSELFAIMCGGLASIAGSVMAGYAQMGVELQYLLAASFMAAPGGLLFAKILMPETEQPREQLPEDKDESEKPVNVLDAAALGASTGLKLALNVGAMLLAFICLIALLNGIVGLAGGWLGYPDVTIQKILGYVFSPLAFLLGIPMHEAIQGGSFIGQKIITNEFVAYADFVAVKDSITPRTQIIVTFALCGFANLSSIAILLGGLGGIAPSRRKEIARYGLLAVLAASCSNFTSAAIAGFFFSFK